jgi:hypothetical protein
MDKLDLHGVKHVDVGRQVDMFLGHHILFETPEVEIITGHSDEMKKLVQETLDDYGLEGAEGIINKGMLIVKLL